MDNSASTIKKRGRKKKVMDDVQNLSELQNNNSRNKNIIIHNNISFGSKETSPPSSSAKDIPAEETNKTEQNLMFGGLNITVHKAEQPDISLTAQSLRFGSVTAFDNVINDDSGSSTVSSSKKDRVIYGEVPKKTKPTKTLPSKMCEIVEHDSDNEEEVPTLINSNTDEQAQDDFEEEGGGGGNEEIKPHPDKKPSYYLPNYPPPSTRKKAQSKRLDDIFTSNQTTLPTSTKIWCWWCCHPFNNEPCYLPTVHDEYRKRFVVVGNFCSWSCVKSYNIDIGDMSVNKRNYIIRYILSKMGQKTADIKPAPPRTMLKQFGGNLSIEEFRKSSGVYHIEKPLSSLTKFDNICIEPQSIMKKKNKLSIR